MRGILQIVSILSITLLISACSGVNFGSKSPSQDATCKGSACATATYAWFESGYTVACSKPCGGGTQDQTVECRDSLDVVVSDSYCTGKKPSASRSCNVQTCTSTYTWNLGIFGNCSKTCGSGVQTRTVDCQKVDGSVAPDASCSTPKPPTTMVCNTNLCPIDSYSWQTTPGVCTKQCDGGTATDVVVCKKNDGTTVTDSFCDPTTKPPTTRTCNTQTCPIVYTYAWEPQAWTACSKTCDGGTQTRAVACKRNDGSYVSSTYCDPNTKPSTSQSCNTQSCPSGKDVTQSLYVTPALNAVDVIIVIDDSSSMKEDQTKLASGLGNLISDLDALKVDYQVCLTTTDTGYYKGSPIKWTGTNSVIMNQSTPNKSSVFQTTINSLGAEWSSDERGIYALNLMIKDFSGSGCMRPEATLTTIMISDEDERSVGGVMALSSVQYQPLEAGDYPDNLIGNVHVKFDKPGFVKNFIWNSIIVKPGDTACEGYQDAQSSPSFYGRTYAELSNKTNGFVGSICDSTYTNNLKFISNKVVNSMPGMVLQCTPIANPVVTFDKPIATTVTLAGSELKFSPVIPQGVTITAKYTCP